MADNRNKAEQELQNLFDDKRFFLYEGEKYYIDNPSIDDARAADWMYSRTYNEALLAGVTTEAQMEEILEERGLLGKAYEEKRQALIQDLDTKIAELSVAASVEDKKLLVVDVEDARNKLFKWNQRASSPMSVTCEQMSNDARIEALTASMVKDSTGKRVWADYESYKTTDKTGLAYMSRYQVMIYLQGLQSDFLSQTPEAVARREIEEDEQKLLGESEATGAEVVEEVKEEKPKRKK